MDNFNSINYFRDIDRRKNSTISEEMIEEIAGRAAEKALEKMESKIYQQVGRTFINRVLQFIGAILIGLAYYLNNKGFLSFHN